MPANVAEWDARHREAAQKPSAEPSSIVVEWLALLPEGPALDLACGRGRNTLALGAGGHSVTAVDWSAVALDILETQARSMKLEVSRPVALDVIGAHDRAIHPVQANLEDSRLQHGAFAVIVCVQYLQRSLFAQMERALQPGGVLLFETFTRAQLNYSDGPHNPAYLLDPGELRTAFPRLGVLFYRELNAGQGIASLVARKPSERVRQ
jgi:tellurite methyltransferase